MLRLHFTYEDLAKVVVNDTPPPMVEAVLSVQMLARGHPPFGQWRARLAGRIPAAVRPLLDLVPARGWIPDFLTPVLRGSGSEAAALEAIRATPVRQVRAELTRLSATSRLPGWIRTLADGDTDAMAALTDALAAWNQLAIAPYETGIQVALDTDRANKTTLLTRHGLDGVLRRLHPAVTWRSPVLTLPSAIEADIHLDGRGLLLAPTLFCGPLPRFRLGDDTGTKPALAYQVPFDPIAANPFTAGGPSRPKQTTAALDRLLGGTRSAVLRTIAATPGLTTADLANQADIAMATASEHTTVLREAGLIISHRDGTRVRHYPTTTAAALLGTAY